MRPCPSLRACPIGSSVVQKAFMAMKRSNAAHLRSLHLSSRPQRIEEGLGMRRLGRWFRFTGIVLTALIGLLFFAGTSVAGPIIVGHTGNHSTIVTFDFGT